MGEGAAGENVGKQTDPGAAAPAEHPPGAGTKAAAGGGVKGVLRDLAKKYGLTRTQRLYFIAAVISWLLSFVIIAVVGLSPDDAVRRSSGFVQALAIAGSLGLVALFTFAAFYSETGVDGMRTAIAATLVVFFLAFTAHMIASPTLRNSLDTGAASPAAGGVAPGATPGPAGVQSPSASPIPAAAGNSLADVSVPFGRAIYANLADFVKIVLLFYFGAISAERILAPTAAGESRTAKKDDSGTGK